VARPARFFEPGATLCIVTSYQPLSPSCWACFLTSSS
jgi:hypothetical protein